MSSSEMKQQRRIGLMLLLVGCSFLGHAQEENELPQDTISSEIKTTTSILTNVGVGFQWLTQLTPTPGGRQSGTNLSAFLYFDRWIAGAYVAIYNDEYTRTLIFPNDFSMNYLHGGIYIGYTFIQQKHISLSGTASYGAGDIIWERSSTFEDIFRDDFRMGQVALELEVTSLRFIRPMVQIGYRTMNTINLPELDENDFGGFTFSAGVKIGFYTKQQKSE
ncbi:MAG: hypothetical protein ACI8QD_002026 [Cyclobacteriaceae bacterium]|jgi:hypothetical protein